MKSIFLLQIFPVGRRLVGGKSSLASRSHDADHSRHERQRLVHLRLQPGTRHRGEHPLAALRPFRRRSEHQGHPRPSDEQVQGIRLRHHDQLRRVSGRNPVPQRLHPRQQGPAGQLQDQQTQNVKRKRKKRERERKIEPSRTVLANTNEEESFLSGSLICSAFWKTYLLHLLFIVNTCIIITFITII